MINIITALQCEAKPLIHHYKLKGESSAAGFRLYQNETIRVVVSGLGKMNCAAACAYLYARHDEAPDQAWLNLGIAGHATATLGTPLLMQKITDQASGLSWYPPTLFAPPCDTATCLTIDRPTSDYPADSCVEMEASGFYTSASRFASAELIHCLKIISDNREAPPSHIDEKKIEGWIAAQWPTIEQLIQSLQAITSELTALQLPPPSLADFLSRWHFSRYQKNQLQQRLQRWQALQPEQPPRADHFSHCQKSKEVLIALQQQLDAMPILFDRPI